jgi:phage/plasmid-like protein (TIGR03299 family)
MPAAIANDGKVDLFASHREPAWHGLGTVFTEEVTDYRRMLTLAGLSDWNIREMPLVVADGVGAVVDDITWEVSAKAVVADMNGRATVLGVTGDRYEIVQNEDAFSFLQSLRDGAVWETAGAIKGGRVVFGSMALDREIVLDPTGVSDVVKSYLLVHTSHDGSTGVAGGVTPVRVVCQNTLNAAMGNIKNTFKLRHTTNVADRMTAEAALWRTANTYMDAFEAEARTLFQTKATDKDYFGIVTDLFPKPEEDKNGAEAKWEKRQALFAQAWNGKPNAGIKNTAWGVFNALTEANQWGRNVRKGDKGAENFAAAGAGFDIPTNQFRAEAFSRAKALVKA